MGDDYTPYRCRQGDVVDIEKPLVFGKPTRLIEMPIAWSLDDFPHFEFLRMETQLMPGLMNANHVMENWINDFVYMKEHFDWGVLTYTLHPYVIGRGHRMMAFEKLLKAVAEGGGTFVTMEDAALEYDKRASVQRGMKTFRSHDGFEIAYYVDDFTDPWTTPDTILLLARGDGQLAPLVPLGAAPRAPLPRRAHGPAGPRRLAEAQARGAVLPRPAGR